MERIQQGDLVAQIDQVLDECKVIMAGRFQVDHYLAWHRPQTFEKPAELVEGSPIHSKAHLTDDLLRVWVDAAAW